MVKVGIIGAMELEVSALKGQIKGITVKKKAGMEFCEGWVRFGIGNRRGYPPSFIFNAASPSSGSSAFLRYSLPDTQETSGPVPFRILECAGVKVRHLSNWYEW